MPELVNRHRHDSLPHDFAMTGSAIPSGPAGGDFTGTYPNPTLLVPRTRMLFSDFTLVGNGTTVDTSLVDHIIALNTWAANGDEVEFFVGGTFAGHATATQTIRLYLEGVNLWSTGALAVTAAGNWACRTNLIRQSNTVLAWSSVFSTNATGAGGMQVFTGTTTGLALATTTYHLKINGQAGGVGATSNQVSAQLASQKYTHS